MLIVSVPTSVQLEPFDDAYALNILPLRTIRTQYGALPEPPEVFGLAPPVEARRWNASPLPGLTNIDACFEPGASVSRIMTPALVQGSVLDSVATRAVTVPSPVIVRDANWNSSAEFQM